MCNTTTGHRAQQQCHATPDQCSVWKKRWTGGLGVARWTVKESGENQHKSRWPTNLCTRWFAKILTWNKFGRKEVQLRTCTKCSRNTEGELWRRLISTNRVISEAGIVPHRRTLTSAQHCAFQYSSLARSWHTLMRISADSLGRSRLENLALKTTKLPHQ